MNPTDIASIFQGLEEEETKSAALFRLLPKELAAESFVEMSPELFSDKVADIQKRERGLEVAMRGMLGIGPKVHLVPPKSIQRSEGKAVRVIDKRKLHD